MFRLRTKFRREIYEKLRLRSLRYVKINAISNRKLPTLWPFFLKLPMIIRKDDLVEARTRNPLAQSKTLPSNSALHVSISSFNIKKSILTKFLNLYSKCYTFLAHLSRQAHKVSL